MTIDWRKWTPIMAPQGILRASINLGNPILANRDAKTGQPVGVSIDLAAGVAQRTAYHALVAVARLQPGEEVVVLGAGGGVGLAAVQIAAVLGARVTGVTSSATKQAAVAAAIANRRLRSAVSWSMAIWPARRSVWTSMPTANAIPAKPRPRRMRAAPSRSPA